MTAFRVCLGLFLATAATPAAAQGDLFSLFGTGAEAKAHAGAGQLHSREAPAIYYNPANLTVEEGPAAKKPKKGAKKKKPKRSIAAPYFELDVLSLSYTFQYPKSEDYDFEAVEVAKTTPVPFFGATVRPIPHLGVGVSFLPLPGDSAAQKIEKLPSRDLGADPILVDATTSGEGLGYRFALGAAYELLGMVSAGASIQMTKGKTITEASSHDDGASLLKDTRENKTMQFLIGTRVDLLNDRLSAAFTLRLPQKATTTGESEIAALPGEVIDKSIEKDGPMGLGFGATMKVWKELAPYVEVFYENWASLADQEEDSGLGKAKVDYLSTLDIKLGADYGWRGMRFNASFGLYPSQLGDGFMKIETEDEEKVGYNFKTLDAMPHKIFAAGWRKGFLEGERLMVQTGVSYLTGSRSVGEKSRGYGEYEMSIFQLIAGGYFRL